MSQEPMFVLTAVNTQRADQARSSVYYAVDVMAVNRALPRLQKKYGSLYVDWRIDSYSHPDNH